MIPENGKGVLQGTQRGIFYEPEARRGSSAAFRR